ncbi:hypothetical protein [Nocardioides ultimimeridianus]
MSDDTEPRDQNVNVAQDAELLFESVREMKLLSSSSPTTREMHGMLGNLAKAGHLLPEVLNELSERLDPTTAMDGSPSADSAAANAQVEIARAQMQEAADLALRAGIHLLEAQKALESIR